MQRLGLRSRPQQMVNFGGGTTLPPYFADISRWLRFDPTTLTVVDQIGMETRDLQPDRCITGDGVSTITFPAIVDSIKYYDEQGAETTAAISGAWIIPASDIVQIDEYDGGVLIGSLICESGNDLILYDVSGNGNHATLSSTTVWNTTLRSSKNWLNRFGYGKAAYFNGLTSKIVPNYTNTVTSLKMSFINQSHSAGVYYGLFGFGNNSYFRFYSYILNGVLSVFYRPTATEQQKNFTLTKIVNTLEIKDTNKVYLNGSLIHTFTGDVFAIINTVGITKGFGILFNGISLSFPYKGYIFDVQIGNYIDPLNGSTIGTATNIDFNRISIPNKADGTDLFGRGVLYSGVAKMNALWNAARSLLDFNPTDATTIGEPSFRFFDASDTDVWDGSAAWLAEFDPLHPYVWNETMLDPHFILSHVNYTWHGFAYQLIKSGALTDLIAYATARTSEQEAAKLMKYQPNYFE